MSFIGVEHVFSTPLRPQSNGREENSVKQVKRVLHQAILHYGIQGKANWDILLPQTIATLNSYCPPSSTMSRQNLCFNPHYGGYIRTIQYNNELFSPILYSMQQTEGFKRLEARKKRLLALSNIAKPKASQSLIVPGTYCVINRKPEEFLLDDKHTSSLTLKTNKLFKILEITKFDDRLNIPKEVKVQDMRTGRILQFDCDRLQHLHLADAFDF